MGLYTGLASRITDQAQGGEIIVSSLLKELTDSAGDIQFGEGQEVELKGLAGLNRVYSVEWEYPACISWPPPVGLSFLRPGVGDR